MRAERNRCVDLLRVGAIGAVVIGHWLLVDITYRGGLLSGRDALDLVGWGRWLTLLFQVMPVFFLVGGYANAVSWTAHRERGGGRPDWVRGRAGRLLWPVTAYVAVCVTAAAVARAAGVRPSVLASAGWAVALHLWFLPVYLLLVVLTPLLHAAHRRWGLAVPVVMAVAAAGVDTLVLGLRLPAVGLANYLLVWGSMHQWGFAWQSGTLTTPRWRCRALALAGAVVLGALVVWGPFPVDMIGAGARVRNTAPPSIALLAFAAAQTGLLLMAEPALQRLLTRPGPWARVSRLNRAVMTVYLWHMVPVIVVAVALYPTGLAPQPSVGSAVWLALRLPWLVLLGAVLVPLVLFLQWAQRPLRRLPAGLGPTGWWSPVLLVCGLGVLLPALSALAVRGFAPAGDLAARALLLYVVGLLATVCSGHGPPGRGRARGGGGAADLPSGSSPVRRKGSAYRPPRWIQCARRWYRATGGVTGALSAAGGAAAGGGSVGVSRGGWRPSAEYRVVAMLSTICCSVKFSEPGTWGTNPMSTPSPTISASSPDAPSRSHSASMPSSRTTLIPNS
ncbi:acyltransferase [Streptomyces shenzhenensis]|uniref:acyltransferase family protein n=1 Tax=Streptomyces shenzhenensis TaxID=943815 RepID=UPI0033C16CAC